MYKGTEASAGIGIGKAVLVRSAEPVIRRELAADADAEVERLRKALADTAVRTEKLASELASRTGEKEAGILQAHLMLLSDPTLIGEIESFIRKEAVCSEYAVEAVCSAYAGLFSAMDDERMRQRAADVKDIKNRLQQVLQGIEPEDAASLPPGSVILAKDLTPSMTAGILPSHIAGIVTEQGSRTSHSAILARALEIPAVVAAAGILDAVSDGDDIIVDGNAGEVILRPSEAQKAEYRQKREQFLREKKELERYIGRPTVTLDGVQVELAANIASPEDVEKVLRYDGEAIGLFRTEFLFMDRACVPAEEEQFQAYRKTAAAMGGRPVIIRTLDIGGDKEVPCMGLKKEENPFLGYRAVRLCLDRKEDIYRPQLRAILRASAFGTVRIMIPMVTSLEEFRETRQLIREIQTELTEEGTAFDPHIPVGIMVETPAAVLLADSFAREADFFSIGTNDLTQYTLCVDRGSEKVSDLYSPFHPAVLRSIRHIITCGRNAGIPVGMCGEAASDPMMIPLLLAFGLNEFSMSPSAILQARKIITGYRAEDLQEMAAQVMKLETAGETEDFLRAFAGC